MNDIKVNFPDYIDRCCGFSIPFNGTFYLVSFDDLAIIDTISDTVKEINLDWDINEEQSLIIIGNKQIPFIGLWGGTPILHKKDFGDLSLQDSKVCYKGINGILREWQFENFSGDWEQVTFDSGKNAFLYGTPYGFDFRYVEIK